MFGEGGDKYTKGLHDGSGEVQVLASRGTGIYSNDDYKSYLRGQGLNWDKWFWDLMRSGDRWAQNGGTESLGRSIASLNSLVNFGNAYTGYTSGANIYGESIGKGQATVELASGFLGMVPGGAGGKALVAEEGIAFRYMTEGELQAIRETGLLRGGRVGETFFTKDIYRSALKAQQRLALPSKPTLRVEFQILNNPALLRNGTKVHGAFGMPGGGSEFMTMDPVRVKLINWQSLH